MTENNEIEITEGDFVNYIANTRKGVLLTEINQEIKKAVAAVKRFNGTATLNLKISIKKLPEYENVLAVMDDLTVKVPKADRGSQLMFPTEANGISFSQQEQADLFENIEKSDHAKPALEHGQKVSPIK